MVLNFLFNKFNHRPVKVRLQKDDKKPATLKAAFNEVVLLRSSIERLIYNNNYNEEVRSLKNNRREHNPVVLRSPRISTD